MISMKATPPVPQDREVTVTVSLTFPESQLQRWAQDYRLGRVLADEFHKALYEGKDDNFPYKALDNLT